MARNLVRTAVGASVIGGLAAGGTGVATAASIPGIAFHHWTETSIGRSIDDLIVPLPSAAGAPASWTSAEGSVVQLRSKLPDPVGGSAVSAGLLDIDWPADPGRASRAAAVPKGLLDIDWPAAPPPVVVVRGDSLWSIAAHHLPAHASDAQIQMATQQWFLTNAAAIGDNPNLILPGQILQPPNQETDL